MSIVGFVVACAVDAICRFVDVVASSGPLRLIGAFAILIAWIVLAISVMLLGHRHRLSTRNGWVGVLCVTSGVLMLAGVGLMLLFATGRIDVAPWNVARVFEVAVMPLVVAIVSGGVALHQLLNLVEGRGASRRAEIVAQVLIVVGTIGLLLAFMAAVSAPHSLDLPESTLYRVLSVRYYLVLVYSSLAAYLGVRAYRSMRVD